MGYFVSDTTPPNSLPLSHTNDAATPKSTVVDLGREIPNSHVSSAFSGTVPARIKGAYAFGASAETIFFVAFSSFNFFFYTNLLGLSGTLAGLAITLSLILDAISDPLVGAISDRWRSKLGRRHPFMYAAPIPVMLSLYFLYAPPEGLGQLGLFIWLTGSVIVMQTSFTLFHVPHLALGAELSSDFYERTRVMGLNTLLAALGASFIFFIAMSFFFETTPTFSNGLMNTSAYPLFAATAAVLGGTIMFASAFFTRKLITKLPQPSADLKPFSLSEFFDDIKAVWSNRNYRTLLIGFLLLSATTGTRETISMHMNTYFWELTTEQIRFFALALLIGPFIGFFITTALHRRYDKKPTIIGALITMWALAITPVSCRILGIFPDNHTPLLFYVLFLSFIVFCIFGTVFMISSLSALADIADEHELNTHRRQEGIFFAARSFFAKASQGVGHLIAGVALDLIDFPVGAEPGTVAAEKVFSLGLIDGPLAALPITFSILFFWRYRLTRARQEEIQSTLRNRYLTDAEKREKAEMSTDAEATLTT